MKRNKIRVELNGVLLTEGEDYYWIPGKLVLKKSRPRKPVLTWKQKLVYALKLEWDEITRERFPFPDWVLIENFDMHDRANYLFGTPDFDRYIAYEEDFPSPPAT